MSRVRTIEMRDAVRPFSDSLVVSEGDFGLVFENREDGKVATVVIRTEEVQRLAELLIGYLRASVKPIVELEG